MTIIRGECDCCDRVDVILRKATVTGIETYACAVCHHDPHDWEEEAREEEEWYACTCSTPSVNSASIDPPEPKSIRDPWCPVHGKDPDEEYERRRDDAECEP